MSAHCSFYVRQPAGDGKFTYERVELRTWHGSFLPVDEPPAVGDLIYLYDDTTKRGDTFRVVERSWLFASYGSADWPYGEPKSAKPPLLDLIVEPDEGPFRDEVETGDEE